MTAKKKIIGAVVSNNGIKIEMGKADLKRKRHKGRRKIGSSKRRNRRRIRLGLKIRRKR